MPTVKKVQECNGNFREVDVNLDQIPNKEENMDMAILIPKKDLGPRVNMF